MVIENRPLYIVLIVIFCVIGFAAPRTIAAQGYERDSVVETRSSPPLELPGSNSVTARAWPALHELAQAGDQMPRRLKAFLPTWILWIALPGLVLMWAIVTFSTFRPGAPRTRYAILRWVGATALFTLVGIMLWLMASGRLPAFLVEPV